jgi:hypothetical protein
MTKNKTRSHVSKALTFIQKAKSEIEKSFEVKTDPPKTLERMEEIHDALMSASINCAKIINGW